MKDNFVVEDLNGNKEVAEVDNRYGISQTASPIFVTQTGVINVRDIIKGINGLMIQVNKVKGYVGCSVKWNAQEKRPEIFMGFDINQCPSIQRVGGNGGGNGFAPLISRNMGSSDKGVEYSELFEKINGVFVGVPHIKNLQTAIDNNRLFVKINTKIALMSIMGIDIEEADVKVDKFEYKVVSKEPNDIQIIFSIISGEAIDEISAKYNKKKDKKNGHSQFNPSLNM